MLLICLYFGCFQLIASVHAAIDCNAAQTSPSEDCVVAQSEIHSFTEIVPERDYDDIYIDQFSIINNQSLNNEQDIQKNIPVTSEEPAYLKTDEVGGDWTGWIKWFFFFVMLSLTLTPFTIMQFARNGAVFFAVGALVGAERSKVGAMKGAANGIRITMLIFLIGVFLGPYGMLYCIYHPLLALFSEADRTYCCTMTWLGHDSISKKSISADGHWLAEVQEQTHEYLGLGNKQFVEKNVLSVINLTTGKHVRWPQSGKKHLGVNPDQSQIEEVVINDGIWIRPANYLMGEVKWYSVELGNNFLRPVNYERTGPVKVSYQLLNNEDQQEEQLQFVDVNTGRVNLINPEMKYDRRYLSHDGRVLAIVKGPQQGKSTDGLIRQIIVIACSYLFESWKIEFWNVATEKKMVTYSGHGINSDAWTSDKFDGRAGLTKFLESSSDGRFWYMIKSDGYIHVFDMSKHIPAARRHVG